MKKKYRSYKEYLKSPEWQAKRKAVFERALKNAKSNNRFGVCEVCHYQPFRPGKIQVHHLKYPKQWGTESIDDLVCVCIRCHKKLHAQNKADAVS